MVEDYFPVYKCPICNQLCRFKPIPLETSKLSETISLIQKVSQFAANPYLTGVTIPMHIVCKCANGSMGYAAFAGFEKVNKTA